MTADQIIVDGDTAYVVAEGEPCAHCRTLPLPILCSEPVPPAWMTATCETCDGPGWVCYDCLNGKPIHTFDVECDGCGCGCDCSVCHPPSVTYRLAVRDVLPIHLDTDERAFRPDKRCVIIGTQGNDAGWVAVWSVDGDFTPITLPPAAKPGMHLAICTRHEPENP
jgi:hypothetical protein